MKDTLNKILKNASDVSGDIYVWTGNHVKKASSSTIETANEIWRKTTDLGKEAKENTFDISNKLWKKTTETGPVLQQMILKAYDMSKSSQTKKILDECQEIAVIITRISGTIFSIKALNIIIKRTRQGAKLGNDYIPIYGAIIGTTLGAAFGLCEVANELQKDSLLQDAKTLYKHCETLVSLIKKSYNADMSPLAAGTEQLSPVSEHPFVENPRPITFGKRPVIPGYDD